MERQLILRKKVCDYMDMRTALDNGTVLKFENDTAAYTIQKEQF